MTIEFSKSGIPLSYLSTDGTMAANSDTKVPTEKAIVTYVAAAAPAESDPVVGAITGVVKADGAGAISAATAWTDYASASFSYSGLADHAYIGFTIAGVAGEPLAIGDVVYLKAADSRWWKAKADVSTTMSVDPKIAVSVAAAGGDAVTLLEWGYIRHDAWSLTTNGAPVYVSSGPTSGVVTGTAPSTAGYQVQILGEVTDVDNIIKFNPSPILLEVGSGLTLPLLGTIASSATPYPSSDGTATGTQVEFFTITALAAAAELQVPIGTPTNGQRLLIRITDNGVAKGLTYNAIYAGTADFVLPNTTVGGATMYINFIYNSTTSKWDYIGNRP